MEFTPYVVGNPLSPRGRGFVAPQEAENGLTQAIFRSTRCGLTPEKQTVRLPRKDEVMRF